MFQVNSNDCSSQNIVQPDVPKLTTQNKSFHLQNLSESSSIHRKYSLKYDFKQKIDSMFDETRSAILESENVYRKKYVHKARSDSGALLSTGICNSGLENITKYRDERKIKNLVQARIEKMFADVSSSEIEDDPSTINAQQFQVDYIGSLPLFSKVTSLQGLQEPLKDLYFNYRKNKFTSSKLQVLLEISMNGLKVQNFKQNSSGAAVEQLNPFPSIAVWAALKFVCRPQQAPNGQSGLEYAFLPIVVDNKTSEKSSLFRTLDQNDISCAIEKTYDDHSPLFVVIMRKNGASNNRLQCHGFACATSEDAIVLAANLYKALVATMTHNQTNNGSLKKRRKVKCCNGLGTVCSVAGSSVCGESDYLFPERKNKPLLSNKTELPKKIPPPRPPRKNKGLCNVQKTKNVVPSQINLEPDEIIAIDDINMENEGFVQNKSNIDTQSIKDDEYTSYRSKCDKTAPSVCSLQSLNSEKNESGDIFTKLVIPRSGSFLNSGPFTSRYSRCTNGYSAGINCSNRKNSLHSPLGFIELFNELRIHEGLNNIDEILNTIIDVDGMSFNSLKPIYKEFIIKLAVTLTKDELYQRSKSIMQKQKRRKRQIMLNRKRSCISGCKIKRAFHVSVSKFRPSRYKIGSSFSSYFFPTFKKMQQNKQFKPKMKLRRQNISSTLTSNDSFVLGFNRHRIKYNPNDIYRDKSFYLKRGEISFHRKKVVSGSHIPNMTMSFNPAEIMKHSSINEESASLIENQRKNGSQCSHENISGYVSCSECSYNTDSCKYKSSKKCYCSMRKPKKNNKVEKTEITVKQSSVSSCSCDTDSCIESEKCYCSHNNKPSIFEQLRQQGFAASESSLSRPSSPVTSWQKNDGLKTTAKQNKTCLQASKSLEFFHVQKNISRVQLNYKETKICPKPDKMYDGSFEHNETNHTEIKEYSIKPLMITSNNSKLGVPMLKHSIFNENNEKGDNNEDNYVLTDCENNFNYTENLNEDDSEKDTEVGSGVIGNSESHFNSKKHNDNELNKILVVSARDQKGQVKNSVTPLYNKSIFSSSNIPNRFLKNENIHEIDAISIKKTAEIAALFSDMKVEKKNHLNIRCDKDVIYNSLNPPNSLLWSRTGSMCIKNINLENSLGYFP